MGKASFDFGGETVIVTGAARGIGLEFARTFAAAGAEKPPESASTRPVCGSIATMAPDISGNWRNRYWPSTSEPSLAISGSA